MEANDSPYDHDFVHDEGLDCPSPLDEKKEELRRLVADAALSSEQQQQLRQVSARYAVLIAPVPEENTTLRERCLAEAIIQSDLSHYDVQAVENSGVAFDAVEGKLVVYVNDSPLAQSQLEGIYQFISPSDQIDLEEVRIAFEARQAEALEAAYSAPAYEGDRRLAKMQPAIEAPPTIGSEFMPLTAQVKKMTRMILDQLVGTR